MPHIPGDTLEINRKERAQTPSLEISDRLPTLRICDFEEVRIPFTPEQAMYEASRCIECPDPAACVRSCPVHNDIPSAMWLISQGEFLEAAKIYRKTSSPPEICGRVCPHDKLCQGSCVQGKHDDPVATGMLEAFVIDYERKHGQIDMDVPEWNGKKVAIVGSGPSGLSAAEQLAKKGYKVTIFEAKPQPGGLLLYGIPNFKLDKDVVFDRIEEILTLGVEFVGSTFIGKDKTIDGLFEEGYESVYVAVGTWIDAPMEIPGEDLPGVYKGSEYLIRNNVCDDLFPLDMTPETIKGKKIVVIGGGDTASDCLRTAVRMEADQVTCVYRRTEAEMPGSSKDRKLAKEEGADYQFLTQPVKFMAGEDGNLGQIECIRMELGEPDKSGRRRPVPIEGSNFTIDADVAVLALGYWPDETIGKTTPDLETHKWGLIQVNESQATSRPGVFAGGDAATGPDLVVTAMRAGRNAAAAIDAYLMETEEAAK
ncbi:MAG TPA: NAD(P)-dependent oxidoreductase [Anaerolineales bacterium]|nr:NAD(P)-dependent oxidoreductase [Anaerolineales bacterium]